jgi:DNA mismatch repair protein MutS
LPEVDNVHLDATEHQDDIVFLHAVRPGPASRSYGLQVAQKAGVPREVIASAKAYLGKIERQHRRDAPPTPQASLPLAARDQSAEVIGKLRAIDPDKLAPREALELLYALRSMLSKD